MATPFQLVLNSRSNLKLADKDLRVLFFIKKAMSVNKYLSGGHNHETAKAIS